jgi:hypothetical protein
MLNFAQTLEKYGADRDALRRFDEDGYDLLPYATLVAARSSGDANLRALVGVYEWQNTPLVFLVDGDQLDGDPNRLKRIRRLLAMRGDAKYLGVVRLGQLTIYDVGLDKAPMDRVRIELPVGDEQTTFARLGNIRPETAKSQHKWISTVILNLLSESIDGLIIECGVDNSDAISLVGRALFTRFLGDRNLLPASLMPNGEPDAACLFDTPELASATSDWLDTTFNGDFLPLPLGIWSRLDKSAFVRLGNIARRADKNGQLFLGWEKKWDHLHFAHIPVGVLSQAYELYLRKHVSEKQQKEGGFYTPHAIADLMVRGAFHALRTDETAHIAKVLDPAAGAGMFLLTTFRQLVAERWRHDNVRPDTKILREMLYGQITGFDINEQALRFAALGLYLISIELDPDPEPVEKLRFEKNLRGTVLHMLGEDISDAPSRSLGSLGPRVSDDHVGRYDLVIGNPPWSSATGLKDWPQVIQTVERIAIAGGRLPKEGLKPRLPNELLDLPFVWRAMEWARDHGQIAFALHARLLFQQGDGMTEARQALFHALDVTGIINGAELRNTPVWPNIQAPFCLLFARNRPPSPSSGFRFVSPHIENSLNNSGAIRVDASNAEIVPTGKIQENPSILKILFRGSTLDAEILERMRVARQQLPTFSQYWSNMFGFFQGSLKYTGNGYQKLRPSSRIRKRGGDGLPGKSAVYLNGLPNLISGTSESILLNTKSLEPFALERIHDPRLISLFHGPLVIVQKSPRAQDDRIRVTVSDNDVAFSETYYGYSTRQHPNRELLARYIALVFSSKPAFWHVLMTSGEFGFEREVVEKFVIEEIPILPLEELSASNHEQIALLFDSVTHEDSEENWARVDAWVATLYGLQERDLQVIADTLKFNLPFAANGKAAQKPPGEDKVVAFCDYLNLELQPWGERFRKSIVATPVNVPASSPWRMAKVVLGEDSLKLQKISENWQEIMYLADQLATTEILYPAHEENCLWIARLNHARYWSSSQARLVARRIIWQHVNFLVGRQTV